MKNLIKLCLVAIIILLPFSCTQDSIDGIKNFNKNENSKASVIVEERPDGFPDGDWLVVEGASSTLKRNENGITVNFKTNGLIPGNAYTLWWIVFGEVPGPPASLYATGHVVGASGTGNFSAHLSASSEFNNPQTAEVHMVLRTHGPAVPGVVNEQIGEYNGGCVVKLPFGPGRIWPDSDEVGRCADIQVAKHPSLSN